MADIKSIEDKLYFFDTEVFAEDWLAMFISYKNPKEKYIFHNDSKGLVEFMESIEGCVIGGYNCKHYDYYILKGCMLGYDPFVIKEINDFIIVDGEQGWKYPFDYLSAQIPNMLDLMLDIVPMKSLKEIEGNLGLNITESSIDFDYAEKWTAKDFKEIVKYCQADIEALFPLYELRKPYIEAKLRLAEMCGIAGETVLALTNAKLTAEFLKASKRTVDEEEEYVFPENLAELPEDITNFFKTMESKFNPDGTVNEDASSSYQVDIAGCPHKLGFGGLHGALNNYEEESSEDRLILNYDVTSYYPSLMINYGYISRACENPDLFIEAYNLRVSAKSEGDKATSEALKLVLNTTFGASNNKYNKLYDPLMAKSICVSGQCFLIDLILMLNKIPSLRLIQSNTDGIMFSVNTKNYDLVQHTIKKWCKRTKFDMEEERVRKILQRDVNNYIMVTESGKVKTKGGAFASYDNDGQKYKSNSMAIVGEALVKWFVDGTDISETINACNEVEKFQIISKTGSTYGATVQFVENGFEIVQKCNRIFASKHESAKGVIKKVKFTTEKCTYKKTNKRITERALSKQPNVYLDHEEDDKFVYRIHLDEFPKKKGVYIARMDTVANCPKQCIISNNFEIGIDKVDKSWYTGFTLKELRKMKGEERDDS